MRSALQLFGQARDARSVPGSASRAALIVILSIILWQPSVGAISYIRGVDWRGGHALARKPRDNCRRRLSGPPRVGLETRERRAQPVLADARTAVSYTHLRAHETDSYLVCRLLLEKKKK